MLSFLKKPFEFWPNETHQIPFWSFVALRCLSHRLSPLDLLKANTGIPSGGLHFVSKYQIQKNLGEPSFPATKLLSVQSNAKDTEIADFAKEYGYPLFLKPDSGMTGRGMKQIQSEDDIQKVLPLIAEDDYLLQEYVEGDFEYGVFWTRIDGVAQIVGINQKHYPTVKGDGTSTIQKLALESPRHTSHWNSFLSEIDTSQIPAAGEKVFLSRIGSHTLGCRFSDESDSIQTDQLQPYLEKVFPEHGGYDYGRLDIKATSRQELEQGNCTIIEANGIASQPTHMFDSKYTFKDAIKILWRHSELMVKAAKQNRQVPMEKPNLKKIIFSLRETTQAMQRLQSHGETL